MALCWSRIRRFKVGVWHIYRSITFNYVKSDDSHNLLWYPWNLTAVQFLKTWANLVYGGARAWPVSMVLRTTVRMFSGPGRSFSWRQTISDLTLEYIYLGRNSSIGAVLGVLRFHHDDLIAHRAGLLLSRVIVLFLMVAEMGHVLTCLEILDLVCQATISTYELLLCFINLGKSLHAATPAILLLTIKSTSTALNALRCRHIVVYPTFVFISFAVQDKVLTFSHINRFFESSFIETRLNLSLLIWELFLALCLICHIIFIITLILFRSVFRYYGVDIFGWGLGCIFDAFVLDLVLLWLCPLRN